MSNINTGTSNVPIPDTPYTRWRRSKMLSYMTAWQQGQPKDYRNPTMLENEMNKEAVRIEEKPQRWYKFQSIEQRAV